ncbi:HTH-type transcriptional regulator McbR [Roseovarius albus]|uniref:HTH-type transcriptional regulator McbR n=1 Tax=Roseovarius albus TaxID=1247867 RepID=A0A1X6ZQP9_9RHOB|nr:GntR family transcriptional regulator [Roseovarius albus]SLN58533.1 HTH-type transcriptional regulator McbR [Roseovarius albus]
MDDIPSHKNASLSEIIYAQLKTRLMLGAYLPGDRLSMRKLATEFGTSPMPVREALKRLTSEHAIESAAAKAYNIPKLSNKRAADLFYLRGLLEVAALEAAYDALTPDIIGELSALSDRMLAHLKLRDFPAYMSDNHRFHFLIYGQVGNPDMVFMIQQLWMQTGPSLHLGLQQSSSPAENWNTEHIRFLQAIRASDRQGAVTSMRDDVAWGQDFYST